MDCDCGTKMGEPLIGLQIRQSRQRIVSGTVVPALALAPAPEKRKKKASLNPDNMEDNSPPPAKKSWTIIPVRPPVARQSLSIPEREH